MSLPQYYDYVCGTTGDAVYTNIGGQARLVTQARDERDRVDALQVVEKAVDPVGFAAFGVALPGLGDAPAVHVAPAPQGGQPSNTTAPTPPPAATTNATGGAGGGAGAVAGAPPTVCACLLG